MNQLNSESNEHKCLTEKAISKLKLGSWPGNVRGLKTTLTRSYTLSLSKYIYDKDIVLEEFSTKTGLTAENQFLNEIDSFLETGKFPKYRDYIEKIERKLLRQALVASKGNKKRASQLLQMPYTTYNSKFLALSLDESTT